MPEVLQRVAKTIDILKPRGTCAGPTAFHEHNDAATSDKHKIDGRRRQVSGTCSRLSATRTKVCRRQTALHGSPNRSARASRVPRATRTMMTSVSVNR